MKTYDIETCRECVGLLRDKYGTDCKLDPTVKFREVFDFRAGVHPMCPLRKGPVTLSLKEGV